MLHIFILKRQKGEIPYKAASLPHLGGTRRPQERHTTVKPLHTHLSHSSTKEKLLKPSISSKAPESQFLFKELLCCRQRRVYSIKNSPNSMIPQGPST